MRVFRPSVLRVLRVRLLIGIGVIVSLVVGVAVPGAQERIVSRQDADRIFGLNRSQWEAEARRMVDSRAWRVRASAGDSGTGLMALDPQTGVGLGVQPSFRDPQGPPEKLVVGSYYPPGTFRQFSEQTRRELEAATSSDLGPAYSVVVSFSAAPSPGFDVVEVIITPTRR